MNHQIFIAEKYMLLVITDALRIVRLKLLKCAGIALFTVTSSDCIYYYAIQVIRIWCLTYNAHGYKNIILQ